MSLLTREQLRQLAAPSAGPCVSLYLPTFRGGKEVQQNPIRLKNLLKGAQERLGARGLDDRQVEAFLAPARELLADGFFWRRQSDGLAVFIEQSGLRSFRLPVPFKEVVVVGERCHMKPLLPLLSGDGRFYILSLSQKRVRLFESGRHSLREIDLGAIPESLADAVGYDWEQRSLQFYGGAPREQGGPGRTQDRMFHGQGYGSGEDTKEEIATFLRLVDDGLRDLLPEREAPLVVAAAEPARGIFRNLSKHPNLISDGVEGNPDDVAPAELHRRAWELVEPVFRGVAGQAAERFRELAGGSRASERLEEILPAAEDGRVETLFLDVEANIWGTYDPESRRVQATAEDGDEAVELLDLVAVHSLASDGTIFAVRREELPAGGPVAAIFRY